MKKIILILLVMTMLTGCCLSHEWAEANCTTPKTCAKCGETEGEALGHNWQEANCTTPKTCAACEKTEGDALGHEYGNWSDANDDMMVRYCSVCMDAEFQPADHELLATQRIVGKWTAFAMKSEKDDMTIPLEESDGVNEWIFLNDGSFSRDVWDETDSGRWEVDTESGVAQYAILSFGEESAYIWFSSEDFVKDEYIKDTMVWYLPGPDDTLFVYYKRAD